MFMSYYEVKECVRCHETKKFYKHSDVCQACIWWEKHHNGEKREKPLRIRDGFKSSHLSEYSIYRGMKNRCYNKNNRKFPDYGGRGIKVCEYWSGPLGFHHFYESMGKRPNGCSLDRVDVNGDYCPDNCRWANNSTQGTNKRNKRTYSKQVGVTYNKSLNLWVATLQVNRTRFVKYCKTETEAITARKDLVRLHLPDVND